MREFIRILKMTKYRVQGGDNSAMGQKTGTLSHKNTSKIKNADRKCPQQKNERMAPIKNRFSKNRQNPSFVYRQDGCELSYSITFPVYHFCQAQERLFDS